MKYWVLKNTDVYDLNFSPQHRNEKTTQRKEDYKKCDIYEGQVIITRENIASIQRFEAKGRELKATIIERFQAS